MQAISDLGDTIARRWRETSHNEDALPDIAADALASSDLLTHVSAAELLDHAIRCDNLPEQRFTGFGQPPVVLYRGHEFFIQALFWFDSTTAIHQHSFSGAFAVLEGSSVHSTYDFEQHDRVSSHMLLGDVQFRACEVLERGDVRRIEAGRRFIHALFHLDRPSVSIVVRTFSEPDRNPQYMYLRPGLAVDSFYEPEPMATQLRLLDATREAHGVDAFIDAARILLGRADFWLAYRTLGRAFHALGDGDVWCELERASQKRLGQRIQYLRPVFEAERTEGNMVRYRERIHDAEHRFLLALVLNVPERDGVDRLLRARYGGDIDARERLVRGLTEISQQHPDLGFDPLALAAQKYALTGFELSSHG
jgi:hypothetical protein